MRGLRHAAEIARPAGTAGVGNAPERRIEKQQLGCGHDPRPKLLGDPEHSTNKRGGGMRRAQPKRAHVRKKESGNISEPSVSLTPDATYAAHTLTCEGCSGETFHQRAATQTSG